MPEVRQPRRAEKGVADRVDDAVGVAVAVQAEIGLEPDSPEDKGPAGYRAVDVISMAYSIGHGAILSAQQAGANRNSRHARSLGEVSFWFGWVFSRSATGWPRSSTAAASSVTLSPRRATRA